MNERISSIPFHPGEFIAEELVERSWNVTDLANKTGIQPDWLHSIIKGDSDLTVGCCEKIGMAFGTSAEMWVNLQNSYNAAERLKRDRITAEQEGFLRFLSLNDQCMAEREIVMTVRRHNEGEET